MNLKVTIHLANGSAIETLAKDEIDVGTYLDYLEEELTGDARPGWRQVENVLLFSQALSAIEVEELATDRKASA